MCVFFFHCCSTYMHNSNVNYEISVHFFCYHSAVKSQRALAAKSGGNLVQITGVINFLVSKLTSTNLPYFIITPTFRLNNAVHPFAPLKALEMKYTIVNVTIVNVYQSVSIVSHAPPSSKAIFAAINVTRTRTFVILMRLLPTTAT